jgi:hypothetical protein
MNDDRGRRGEDPRQYLTVLFALNRSRQLLKPRACREKVPLGRHAQPLEDVLRINLATASVLFRLG